MKFKTQIEVVVYYRHYAAEPRTETYPGCPDSVEIMSLVIDGAHVPVDELEDKTRRELEDECLDDYHTYLAHIKERDPHV